jgi:hypothetical protein
MRAARALIACSATQLARSPGILAAGGLFFALVFALSLSIGSGGPPEAGIRFYVTIAWFLVFAASLASAVIVPLRLFAQERSGKLLHLIGTRPLSRFGFIATRFATGLLAGVLVLAIGGGVIAGGVAVLAHRRGVDAGFLAGAAVFPLPPREVSSRALDELARQLGADEAFREQHGDAGVRRIALTALSTWRLSAGEEATITWSGLPRDLGAGRIRFRPRVYPVWEEVEAEFRFGREVVRQRLRSGVPAEFPFGPDAVTGDGDLPLTVRVIADGKPVVVFEPPDGLGVYVPYITFGENLLRAGALVLMLVAACAALGVLVGATLSYPVGILAVVVIVLLGLGSTLFTQALSEFTEPLGHYHHGETVREPLPAAVRDVWRQIMLAALRVVPTLGTLDPGTELAEGRSIGMARIAAFGLDAAVLRGGGALLAAWLLFRRQELGKRR